MKDVSITLVNESCFSFLKELKSNSIDLALIDPPYEVSRETNFKSGEAKGKDTDRFRVSMNFGDWDSDFTGLDEVIKELYRVLRKGGTLICFYDIWKISILRRYFDDAKFRQIRFIEWVKTNPVPINSKINYLTNAREIAVVAVKESKATFHSEYDNGIYRYPICHDRGRFHPTQKPLALIEELVVKHSNEGDTVLDCFAGFKKNGGYIRQLKQEAKGKFIIDDSDFVETDKTFADVFPNIEQGKLYYVDDESYSVEEVTEG